MTEAKLLELIEGRMPFPATVTLDSSLFEDLGFDSILLLDLIISIEDACGFEFSQEDLSMEALGTPRRLLALVASRSSAKDEA